MYSTYVVEERGTFSQSFRAFFMLLIETKGGLYQGQLYYTNIILEETITLLTTIYLYQYFTNVLGDLFIHACILDELKPYKNVKSIKSFPF